MLLFVLLHRESVAVDQTHACIDDRRGQGDHLKFTMVFSKAFGLVDKPGLGNLSEFNNTETRC